MSKVVVMPKLSYKALRGLQISIVFAFTVLIQELFRYPHAGWTGFAVMMIYAGFDNGTTLLRAFHRFWGMILGLFTGYLLWFLGHLDYRTLLIIIPITIFLAYFLAGQAYSIPTVFTVNTAVIGTGFFSAHNDFSLTNFLVDYGVCTVIALAIIFIFEYFWFRRYHMMKCFIRDTQHDVIVHLKALLKLLNQDKIRRTKWYQNCINLNRSLLEVNTLVTNSQFEISSERAVGEEFNQFVDLSNKIFMGLKSLYSAYYTKRYHKHDYYQLFQQVQLELTQLEAIVADGETFTISSGVIHEAHN